MRNFDVSVKLFHLPDSKFKMGIGKFLLLEDSKLPGSADTVSDLPSIELVPCEQFALLHQFFMIDPKAFVNRNLLSKPLDEIPPYCLPIVNV